MEEKRRARFKSQHLKNKNKTKGNTRQNGCLSHEVNMRVTLVSTGWRQRHKKTHDGACRPRYATFIHSCAIKTRGISTYYDTAPENSRDCFVDTSSRLFRAANRISPVSWSHREISQERSNLCSANYILQLLFRVNPAAYKPRISAIESTSFCSSGYMMLALFLS